MTQIKVRQIRSNLVMTPKYEYKHWMENGKLKQLLVIKGFFLVDLTSIPF